MKLEVIIEKGDGELWGRIEGKGNYLPTTVGESVSEIRNNLRIVIKDYLKHEGGEDKFWKKINLADLDFDIHYDLLSFLPAPWKDILLPLHIASAGFHLIRRV